MRELERQLGVRTGYDAWLDAGLNNAHLASIATYFDCVPGFERLLAEHQAIWTPTMRPCALWGAGRSRHARRCASDSRPTDRLSRR